MGVNYYRFSISWSRVLPGGKVSMGKNVEGINYYNRLIDELQANGIEPFVTLYHWDLPNALEEEYMGFLSTKIVDDFVNYAELCFWEFGDRVKHWVTFNEPYRFTYNGYVDGTFAPGRGGKNKDGKVEVGDPETEPYIVAANILKCHLVAYRMYEEVFKSIQNGQVGITLDATYLVPADPTNPDDIKAVEYALEFSFGWFMEPLVSGTWPKSMQKFATTPSVHHATRSLYEFTEEEKKKLINSYDFLGINYYTSYYAQLNEPPPGTLSDGYIYDMRYNAFGIFTDKHGNKKQIGEEAFPGSWVYLCANELVDLMIYIKKTYKVEKPCMITENGSPELNDKNKTGYEQVKDDTFRQKYLKWHLDAIRRTNALLTIDNITKKPLINGYFAWSFTDSYEWASGYTARFGMNYVDYNDNLHRYPKNSAIWFKKFLSEKKLGEPRKRALIALEAEDEVMNGTPLKEERPVEMVQKMKKAKS
ncbi:hypothetical protein SSX86_012399 [Deinandra increscens subsp. villosa]|uniref:Uncharacterized protein n=1 Tax=Deinandra increscens subsp. villosa TaxID=3103831 RepID=A0AAP0DBU7_9ASTR